MEAGDSIMGLCISWTFALGRGHDPVAVLERLRQAALDLPFESVSDKVTSLEGSACVLPPRDERTARRGLSLPELDWVLITGAKYVAIEPAPKTEAPYFSVPPLELHWFRVGPGLRSEPAIFFLARYPKEYLHGRRRRTVPSRATWTSLYTCKTQYASNHGAEHFLRCHLGLIALLDRAKELGLRVSVRDDGGFARNRSVPKLLEKLSRWNEMVAGLGVVLAAALPPGTKATGGLDGRADLEHLEARGLAHWRGLNAFLKKLPRHGPGRRRR